MRSLPILSTLAILLVTFLAQALTTKMMKTAGNLEVQVSDIDYPQDMLKNIDSGFTTHLLIELKLFTDDKEISQTHFEFKTFYDLWTENYFARVFKEGDLFSETKFKEKERIQEFFENLKFVKAFSLKGLHEDIPYRIEGKILLNPINREKVEKIQKWVADNSVTNTLDSSGHNVPSTSNRGKMNSVFTTIFNQYTNGQDSIGVWKKDISIKTFKLEDLNGEKRGVGEK